MILSRAGHGYTKPPPGAQINWGHPLAPKHAWLFDILGASSVDANFDPPAVIVDLATRKAATGNYLAGDFQFIPTNSSFGIAFEQLSATAGRLLEFGLDSALLSTSAETIAIVHRKTDTTNRIMGWGSTDSAKCGGHLPYSDGTVYFDFNGGNEGSTRISVAGLSFPVSSLSVWVFTAGPRGMEIWRDGALKASHGTNPGTRAPAAASVVRWNGGNGGDNDLNQICSLFIYNRQLTRDACSWVSVEPYAFLLSQSPSVKYFLPSAAGKLFRPAGDLTGVGGGGPFFKDPLQ